jgi:outer membrane protein TolC
MVHKGAKLFVSGGAALLYLLSSSVISAQPSATLSLSDAIALTLSDNPTIKNACDAARGARYGLDIAQSEFGFRFTPQATSGLGTSVDTSQNTTLNLSKKFSTGTSVELSSGTSSSDKGFYRSFTGITLSQSLFRFGSLANTNNVAEAKRGISTAERQAELAKEQVVMDVITAFYH